MGIFFAVSAKDFPCISKLDEQGKCWMLVKDPRDGQEYLSIKACKPISEGGACHIHYVEFGLYDKKVPEKQVLFDYMTFGYLKSAGSLYL